MSGERGDGRVWVRCTVKVQGLGVGQVAHVDPNDPFIASALGRGILVPVGDTILAREERGEVEEPERYAAPE